MYRAAQEREWQQQFAASKQSAIASIRSSPHNMEMLPPIKPVPAEERQYEANISRAYRQRVEQQERDVEAMMQGMEQLSRQRAQLDAQIQKSIGEIDEHEQSMKVCLHVV